MTKDREIYAKDGYLYVEIPDPGRSAAYEIVDAEPAGARAIRQRTTDEGVEYRTTIVFDGRNPGRYYAWLADVADLAFTAARARAHRTEAAAPKFVEPNVTPVRWAFTVPEIPTLYVDQVPDSGRFAVRDGRGFCLDVDGRWSNEPSPFNRDEEFLSRHRFETYEAAAEVARQSMIDAQRPIGEDTE